MAVPTIKYFESLACRKDGSIAIGASSLTGNVWDGCLWMFDSWENYKSFPNLDMHKTTIGSGVTEIQWYQESSLLVATDSGDIEVWTTESVLKNFGVLTSCHNDMVLCVCVSACANNGKCSAQCISGGADGRIAVWDVNALKLVNDFIGHKHWVTSISPHPKEEQIFISTGMDRKVALWDSREVSANNYINCDESHYQSSAWSQVDENIIALGGELGFIHIFDTRRLSEPTASVKQHTDSVHRLSFSCTTPSLLASASDDTDVMVTLIAGSGTASVYHSNQHTSSVHGLAWVPGTSHLLSCGWDGRLFRHTVDMTSVEHTLKTKSEVELDKMLLDIDKVTS